MVAFAQLDCRPAKVASARLASDPGFGCVKVLEGVARRLPVVEACGVESQSRHNPATGVSRMREAHAPYA